MALDIGPVEVSVDELERMVVENFDEYERTNGSVTGGQSQVGSAAGSDIPWNVVEPVVNALQLEIDLNRIVREQGPDVVKRALMELANRIGG